MRVGRKSKTKDLLEINRSEPQSIDSPPLLNTCEVEGDGDGSQTDLSDTSDSGDKQNGTEKCTSPHAGKPKIQRQFAMNIDHMFTLLFVNTQFKHDALASKGIKDYAQTPWQSESGQKTRVVSYVLAQPSGALGPKDVQVKEIETMNACSKPGTLYSIDISNKNYNIPYADNFTIDSHYCLHRVSEQVTEFSLYSEVCFKKNTWGMIRAFIEKNTMSAMMEFAQQMEAYLDAEAEITSSGGKRRHRRSRGSRAEPSIAPSSILPRPSVSQLAPSPSSNSWLGAALTLLLILNGILCLRLLLPSHHIHHLAKRLNFISEPSLGADLNEWSSLLEQYTRRQHEKVLAWQDTLTAPHLYRTEHALRQLIEAIESPPLRKEQDTIRIQRTHNSSPKDNIDQKVVKQKILVPKEL